MSDLGLHSCKSLSVPILWVITVTHLCFHFIHLFFLFDTTATYLYKFNTKKKSISLSLSEYQQNPLFFVIISMHERIQQQQIHRASGKRYHINIFLISPGKHILLVFI